MIADGSRCEPMRDVPRGRGTRVIITAGYMHLAARSVNNNVRADCTFLLLLPDHKVINNMATQPPRTENL